MSSFSNGAHLGLLTPDLDPILKPKNNTFANTRALTIPEEDTTFEPDKFNSSKYDFGLWLI